MGIRHNTGNSEYQGPDGGDCKEPVWLEQSLVTDEPKRKRSLAGADLVGIPSLWQEFGLCSERLGEELIGGVTYSE